MLYNGRDLWPDVINLHPTTILLAMSSVTVTLSTIVLIAGLKPEVRHVGGLGDWLSFGVSSVSLVLAAVGAGHLIGGEGKGNTVWGWTCKNSGVDHPDVQFWMVCGELVGFSLPNFLSLIGGFRERIIIMIIIIIIIIIRGLTMHFRNSYLP